MLDTIGSVPLVSKSSNSAISSVWPSEAVFCPDKEKMSPLDNVRDFNVGGFVGIIAGLCNHKNSTILVQLDASDESAKKILEDH